MTETAYRHLDALRKRVEEVAENTTDEHSEEELDKIVELIKGIDIDE